MVDKRLQARAWTREHGEDLPEVRDWQWSRFAPASYQLTPVTG